MSDDEQGYKSSEGDESITGVPNEARCIPVVLYSSSSDEEFTDYTLYNTRMLDLYQTDKVENHYSLYYIVCLLRMCCVVLC